MGLTIGTAPFGQGPAGVEGPAISGRGNDIWMRENLPKALGKAVSARPVFPVTQRGWILPVPAMPDLVSFAGRGRA